MTTTPTPLHASSSHASSLPDPDPDRESDAGSDPQAPYPDDDVVVPCLLPPPPGYTVACLSNGCALPLGIMSQRWEHWDDQTQHKRMFHPGNTPEAPETLTPLHWQDELVPPAEGAWPRWGTIIASTYEQAVSWCWRRQENALLLAAFQQGVICAACFPERTAWYREEAERLLRAAGYRWSSANPSGPFVLRVSATQVVAWVMTSAQRPEEQAVMLRVPAATIDEAWEELYAAVYEVCHITKGAVDAHATKEVETRHDC